MGISGKKIKRKCVHFFFVSSIDVMQNIDIPHMFFKRFFSSALHITVTFVYYLPLFPLIKGVTG